jgi:hypothetical protein
MDLTSNPRIADISVLLIAACSPPYARLSYVPIRLHPRLPYSKAYQPREMRKSKLAPGIETGNGEFLIMNSRGLWSRQEYLEAEQEI